jgi:hypothetical protein
MMDSVHDLTDTDILLINGLVAFLRLCKHDPVRPDVKVRRIMDTLEVLSPQGVDFIGKEMDVLKAL